MYSLGDFYQIVIACGQLHVRSCNRIGADSLKGFRVYGGLKFGGAFPLKFSASPSGETMRWMQRRFGNARMVRTSSITMSSLVGLGFYTPPGGDAKFDVFGLPSSSSRFLSPFAHLFSSLPFPFPSSALSHPPITSPLPSFSFSFSFSLLRFSFPFPFSLIFSSLPFSISPLPLSFLTVFYISSGNLRALPVMQCTRGTA